MIKFLSHLISKQPASSSWTHLPSFNFFGIRPHEIAKWSIVWDFNLSLNGSDVVHGLDVWRQSTMNAKDFPLDDGGQTEIIENIGAVLPGVGVSVFSYDLVEEAVHESDLAGLVVSSEESDVAWVLKFEAEQ